VPGESQKKATGIEKHKLTLVKEGESDVDNFAKLGCAGYLRAQPHASFFIPDKGNVNDFKLFYRVILQ
jgi:hypothetical protein